MLIEIYIYISVVILGVSERIVAWRWLRADTRVRRSHFSLWAVLILLLPILGVGLYLLFRSHGRLRECPYCQVPSLADRSNCLHCDKAWPSNEVQDQEFLSWQMPNRAAIPFAAIAAFAMTTLITPLTLIFYKMIFGPELTTMVIGVSGTFVVFIGLNSWLLVKTQRARWQDNPLPLLAGVALAMATMVQLGSGSFSSPGMLAFILSLVVALAVSAIIHLAIYDIGQVIIGLVLGYIFARVADFIVTPEFGVDGRFEVIAWFIAPLMLAVAILSARARFAPIPNLYKRTKFLHVAVPLWGLLIFSLLLSLLGVSFQQ